MSKQAAQIVNLIQNWVNYELSLREFSVLRASDGAVVRDIAPQLATYLAEHLAASPSVVSAPARHRYEPDVYVGSPCKVCRLEPTHHSHAVVSAPPKKRHDRSCPAYGNYQPPYEECNCGYESANE